MTEFDEIGAGVYVLRQPVLDVNATLIVGDQIAAIVDTLSTDGQAQELLDQVRLITELPLVVINTHHHFDHCFGNDLIATACPGTSIWAHEEAARILREEGSVWQRDWYDQWLPTHPEMARGLAAVTLRPPDRTVRSESIMELGDRTIELRHIGRGHSGADLIVIVPDEDVVLAGDLVEEGGPPSFGDSYPLVWPGTVSALIDLTTPGSVVVPGHGALVDVNFVRAQQAELAELAEAIRTGDAEGAPAEAVAARAPFGPKAALTAVSRGYLQLAGKI